MRALAAGGRYGSSLTPKHPMSRRFSLSRLCAIIDDTRDQSYLETRLGPLVQQYLAWKSMGRTAARTLDQYERDLARLCLLLPDKSVDQVKVDDLVLVLHVFPERSWKRARAAWNGFFRWAVNFEHITRSPMDKLPVVRAEPSKVLDIFSPDERRALVEQTRYSFVPELDRMRMLLFVGTGARKAEAIGMLLDDVDLLNRAVLLRGKGDKERVVPIEDRVALAVERVLIVDVPVLGRPLESGDH